MRAFIFIAMCLNGLLWLGASVIVLMSLGLELHGNYEYYGNYPVLYLGPGILGFLAPPLLLRFVKPTAAAVGVLVGLPAGTVGGYLFVWNLTAHFPTAAAALVLAGATAGSALGLAAGRAISRDRRT